MANKAFWVYDQDYFYGRKIVFAENHNKAKSQAYGTDPFEDCKYIELRAERCTQLDGYNSMDEVPVKDTLEWGWEYTCCQCDSILGKEEVDKGDALIINNKVICRKCYEKNNLTY